MKRDAERLFLSHHLLDVGLTYARDGIMSTVEVTYFGDKHCVALNTKNGKGVAVDCPSTKREEFGPGGMVGAGLGSCMLMAMASFADRHGLDVSGSRADVGLSFGGKPESHITAIDVTIRVPRTFSEEERAHLEKAAAACPIKHSFRPDTQISTHFAFGDASVEAVA